jgi:hypothetical protein
MPINIYTEYHNNKNVYFYTIIMILINLTDYNKNYFNYRHKDVGGDVSGGAGNGKQGKKSQHSQSDKINIDKFFPMLLSLEHYYSTIKYDSLEYNLKNIIQKGDGALLNNIDFDTIMRELKKSYWKLADAASYNQKDDICTSTINTALKYKIGSIRVPDSIPDSIYVKPIEIIKSKNEMCDANKRYTQEKQIYDIFTKHIGYNNSYYPIYQFDQILVSGKDVDQNISLKLEIKQSINLGTHNDCTLSDLISKFPNMYGEKSPQCLYSLPQILTISVNATRIDYPRDNLNISSILFYDTQSVGVINHKQTYILYAVVHKNGKIVYLDLLSHENKLIQYKGDQVTELTDVDKEHVNLLVYIKSTDKINTIPDNDIRYYNKTILLPFEEKIAKEFLETKQIITDGPTSEIASKMDYTKYGKMMTKEIDEMKTTLERTIDNIKIYKQIGVIVDQLIVNPKVPNDDKFNERIQTLKTDYNNHNTSIDETEITVNKLLDILKIKVYAKLFRGVKTVLSGEKLNNGIEEKTINLGGTIHYLDGVASNTDLLSFKPQE